MKKINAKDQHGVVHDVVADATINAPCACQAFYWTQYRENGVLVVNDYNPEVLAVRTHEEPTCLRCIATVKL